MAIFSTAMDQMEGRKHQLSVFTVREFELHPKKLDCDSYLALWCRSCSSEKRKDSLSAVFS